MHSCGEQTSRPNSPVEHLDLVLKWDCLLTGTIIHHPLLFKVSREDLGASDAPPLSSQIKCCLWVLQAQPPSHPSSSPRLYVKEHGGEVNGGVLTIKKIHFIHSSMPQHWNPLWQGGSNQRDAVFIASVFRSADKPGLYLEAQCVIWKMWFPHKYVCAPPPLSPPREVHLVHSLSVTKLSPLHTLKCAQDC